MMKQKNDTFLCEVEGLSRLFIYGIDSSCAAPSLASLRICVYDGAANKVAS